MSVSIPDALRRTYQVLRSVTYGSGNVGTQGLRVVGTHTAVAVAKSQVIQDNVGGPVITADIEMYFMPYTDVQVDDQILDVGDGSRWRAVKVFVYPGKTIVWSARAMQ